MTFIRIIFYQGNIESIFTVFNFLQNTTFYERNHYHHFVDSCLGGEKPESHFAQSGPMTKAILPGTVAIRVPDALPEWGSANLKVTFNPDANNYLRRTYRESWNVNGF